MPNSPNKSKQQFILQESLFKYYDITDKNRASAKKIDDTRGKQILINLLGLSSVKGIGFKTLCSMFDSGFLLNYQDLTLDQISTYLDEFHYSKKPHEKLAHKIYENKNTLVEAGRKEAEELRRNEIFFIPRGHESYPIGLEKIEEPPRWIFVKGNLHVINSHSIVALVGTRDPSAQGKGLAYSCARELARRNLVVLSGLAKGIDERAHSGAVDYYGQSIGVLGHGFGEKYASENENLVSKILNREGAIITEYLPSGFPSRESFLRRNELIVALSRTLIPIESPTLKSGTGATIRRAKKMNIPILGVFLEGTSNDALIKTKSNLLELGVEVFPISNGVSDNFWNRLRTYIPEHNWADLNPELRQDRFFQDIEDRIKEAVPKLSIDKDAIHRLIERLKKIV